MSPIALAAVSGLLLGASFPPSPAGYIAIVAYIPLLLLIMQKAESMRPISMVGLLYVTFFLYHGITNWWVCSWQENTDPYLFASGIALWIAHPFFLSIPFYALVSIRRRLGPTWMLATAPFSIAGFEWLHGQTEASYPWLSTGYMVVHTPLAQVAELVGVYGLTFLIAAANVAILVLVLKRGRSRVLFWGTVGGLGAWFLMGLYLEHKVDATLHAERSEAEGGAGTRLLAAVVQPNEDPWDKWTDPRQQVGVHIRMVDSLRSLGVEPDVVLWSETAIPYMIRTAEYGQDWRFLKEWVDTSGISLLTGYADHHVYDSGTAPPAARTSRYDSTVRYDVFNAAMMINAGSDDIPVHRKTRLTPFAERLPFADQLTFASSWIEWGVGISSWGLGTIREPLAVVARPALTGAVFAPGSLENDTIAHLGTIICIESIYPEVSRDLVNNGADLLCVITNDAWYNGTWGPQQHYDIARMRAIETRRTVVRCAMSGVSGFILPTGASIESSMDHERRWEKPVIGSQTQGVAFATVQTNAALTVYAMVGDVVPPLGLLVTIILLILARFPTLVRKMLVRTE